MSSDINPPGSEGETVTFEELEDAGAETGEFAKGYHYPKGAKTYKCPPGYGWDPSKKACVKVKADIAGPETCDLQEMTAEELAEFAKGYRYPSAKAKTYKCPPGYAWDAGKRACAKVKKGTEGPETCDLVEVIEAAEAGATAPPSPPEPIVGQGDKYPYTCPAGEVWDPKKKKCVPAKEALEERDTQIEGLTTRLKAVEDALRLKNIETTVEEQIQAGHLAPVQREKAINFLAGIPDEKRDDLIGIFAHQKFPLQEETGGTQTKPPGETKKGIGESETAKDLSEEDKKTLMKRFRIDELMDERGVKKAS